LKLQELSGDIYFPEPLLALSVKSVTNPIVMKIRLPHTILTATGEKIVFNKITIKDGIEYLEGSNEVQPGAGPPMHVHHRQDEGFTIKSGRMAYQVLGGETKYATAGQTVVFKAGEPHKFWNAGNDTLVFAGFLTPADNIIYFLSKLYESINANGGRPAMYDAAFLLSRYRSEFAMLEIPSFVQKFVFPLILFFGNLVGLNKKYHDAPEPVMS
jgi:mannose-6-phosphate isomerase-like protein (cupin superfamily)